MHYNLTQIAALLSLSPKSPGTARDDTRNWVGHAWAAHGHENWASTFQSQVLRGKQPKDSFPTKTLEPWDLAAYHIWQNEVARKDIEGVLDGASGVG